MNDHNLKTIFLLIITFNITSNLYTQPKWPFRQTPSPTTIIERNRKPKTSPKPIRINPKITTIIINDLIKYIKSNHNLTYGNIINITIQILNEFTPIEITNRDELLKNQIKKLKNKIYMQMYIDLENNDQYMPEICFDKIADYRVKLTLEKIITCIYQIFEA